MQGNHTGASSSAKSVFALTSTVKLHLQGRLLAAGIGDLPFFFFKSRRLLLSREGTEHVQRL